MLDKVREIIVEQLGVEPDQVKPARCYKLHRSK